MKNRVLQRERKVEQAVDGQLSTRKDKYAMTQMTEREATERYQNSQND